MFARKIPFAVFALVVGCLCMGCSSKDPERYYSDRDGFSIVFPAEWEQRVGAMGTSVMALSPQEHADDQFRENVNVVVEPLPMPMPLEEYTRLNEANLGKFFGDFQIHERGTTTMNGIVAQWLVYSGKMGTMNMKNLVYLIVHERRGFAITCSSTPYGSTEYRGRFEEIARSFEID